MSRPLAEELAAPMPLAERIPERGFATTDEALDAFMGWVADRGIDPYPHQEEAFLELFDDRHVVLKTPTGSGKSLVGVAMHFLAFAQSRRSVYTAPIKALVSEKFFELCRIFGAEYVGLMTGDGSVNRDAPIVCCTAEVLSNMALRMGTDTPFHAVVMDEFHFYGDRDRGMAWQVPLLTMDHARFLLMSATLGDTRAIEEAIAQRTGAEVAVVERTERPVPLSFRYSERPAHEALDGLIRTGKAPVYAVHFTQRQATELAQSLLSTDISTPDEKAALKEAVKRFRFDSPFGPTLRRMVLHGVGLHHAGLLPKYRLLVEKLAQQGLFRVICGTDTLGVGINVPIRTVFFTQLCKFDGEKTDILSVRHFRQIAGRAGRKGFDEHGYVVAQAPDWVIENAKLEEQIQSGQKKRSKVKKKAAPTKGYKHWDEETFERLQEAPPEALEPRFRVDHALVLSLLQKAREAGTEVMDELEELIDRAHVGQRRSDALLEEARQRLAALEAAGVVRREEAEDGSSVVSLDEELQDDFTLHHGLSLFLLHGIGLLDAKAPDYAMDVVTLVESILEHPKAVLAAQVAREKGEVVAQLKADGVPYEDRLEALEEITWPKPRAPWIYETFNDWVASRPWIPEDPIRPKAVVREMLETQAVFSTYVKGLRLERIEGVLLRYVHQVYRTLAQNVPLEARTPEVDDAIGYLWALLERVDDSLLTEWEVMLDGQDLAAVPDVPVDISADDKTFRARIRAELHALVHALALGDPEEAAGSVHEASTIGADDYARWLEDAEQDGVFFVWDGRVRQGWMTTVQDDGPHRWRVSQRLVTSEDDLDAYGQETVSEEEASVWSVEGVVDLSEDTNPRGPIVRVVALERV